MGIYDSALGFDFQFGESKKIIQIILLVIAILAIGAIGFFLLSGFKPSALGFSFEKNPIKTDETTKVIVTVTNISAQDALDVPVSLRAKESSELQIAYLSQNFNGTIPNLSKGTAREVTFTANPVGKILPGTYVLVARTTINGKDFEKEAVLTVEQ